MKLVKCKGMNYIFLTDGALYEVLDETHEEYVVRPRGTEGEGSPYPKVFFVPYSTKRYVWLNLQDGKFSNCWGEEEHEKHGPAYYVDTGNNFHWKLIEYTCLTDDAFDFTDQMVIK